MEWLLDIAQPIQQQRHHKIISRNISRVNIFDAPCFKPIRTGLFKLYPVNVEVMDDSNPETIYIRRGFKFAAKR